MRGLGQRACLCLSFWAWLSSRQLCGESSARPTGCRHAGEGYFTIPDPPTEGQPPCPSQLQDQLPVASRPCGERSPRSPHSQTMATRPPRRRPSQALLEGDRQPASQRQVALPADETLARGSRENQTPVSLRESTEKDHEGVWGPGVPPRCQASCLLPGSPGAGSCTSRPHPVPMAKERRTHLLLVFMVMMPLHWVFHSIRRPRWLLKSCDLPTSLITWG